MVRRPWCAHSLQASTTGDRVRPTSIGRGFRIRSEKCVGLTREGLGILEQRAVSGVRVRQEYGVGQVLDQAVRVDDRDHLVVNAVDDERRMPDGSKFREALSSEALPIAERRPLT